MLGQAIQTTRQFANDVNAAPQVDPAVTTTQEHVRAFVDGVLLPRVEGIRSSTLAFAKGARDGLTSLLERSPSPAAVLAALAGLRADAQALQPGVGEVIKAVAESIDQFNDDVCALTTVAAGLAVRLPPWWRSAIRRCAIPKTSSSASRTSTPCPS